MAKNYQYNRYMALILFFVSSALLMSCVKDLETGPIDENKKTENIVFTNDTAYLQLLAKCYAGFSTSGQQGPAGKGDVAGVDEGFSGYLRGYFNLQELPTDEAVCSWNDKTIKDFHYLSWTPSDEFIVAFYGRVFIQISFCNEFIRRASGKEKFKMHLAEARFIRALCYWHALDFFGGNIPFVTEDDKPGAFFPKPTTNRNLFFYIENELKAAVKDMAEPRTNEYGRADKAAAWTVLAKLYLNAETYINEKKYTEAITYCKEVIGSGYSLEPEYSNLFLADNHLRTNEIIFAVRFDGEKTQSYNGTSFIINASTGKSMKKTDIGGEAWEGYTTTSALADKFDPKDKRGNSNYTEIADEAQSRMKNKNVMLFMKGQQKEIDQIEAFKGIGVMKYKNITSTGASVSSTKWSHVDFPLFRLADIYLMYAEALKRGGLGGSEGTAITYLNLIRKRAYGDKSGNIGSYDLDFLLDERARELYWEGHRRTDLVRFKKLTTSDYLWPWKGNAKDGVQVDSKYRFYPIPQADITANPNLKQNTGY